MSAAGHGDAQMDAAGGEWPGGAAAPTGLAEESLQAVQQPAAMLDARRRPIFANTAFRVTFGETPDRLLAALRSVPRLDAFLAAEAGAVGEAEEAILEMAQPDGQVALLQATARRLLAKPARCVLVIEDLTERTRLAGQLELAKAASERAERDRSRFLAAASHDLRQPLQGMSMLHGLMAAKAADPTMLRLIGRLDEAIDAMSGILDTLLDINRMEAGRVRAEIAPVPVGPLLASLGHEFAAMAKGAGLDWRVVPSEAVVLSDARLLRQILRNLIANALKYTRRGRILLGCRHANGMLRIEVWDTGIGIPETRLRGVFEESRQIETTARARSQGLGLGLGIVRRLADLLGHPVGVRSRENMGSCFHISIPLAREATDPAQDATVPTVPEVLRILVIEDDSTVGDMLCLLLGQEGYVTMLARDGAEAIALAAEHPPALVIADYNLPGALNGVEVTLQLRQLLSPPPAAILLSGDTSAETRREIGLTGVEYSPKPIRADDLLARLYRLLPTARPRPAAPPPEPAVEPAPAVAREMLGQVFIVDDDATLRRDTAEWLAANGWAVESFSNAEAFLKADKPDRHGCVLVDAVMPGMDGMALLAELRPHAQRLPAIMVTGHGDVRMAVRAMTAGAMDFVEKPIVRSDLLRSITHATRRIANRMHEAAAQTEAAVRLDKLTPRQRQILDRVIAGMPNKIIAADLDLNQRTVENHRATIMTKLGVRSLSELIRKVVSATRQEG